MGGWVRIYTDKLTVVPDDLGLYLSHALTEWFRQRPQLTMLSVVPVVREATPSSCTPGTTCTPSPTPAARRPRRNKG